MIALRPQHLWEPTLKKLESLAIQTGHAIHDELGPGLLKPVYEAVMVVKLKEQGLKVSRNKKVKIELADMKIDEGFRYDLLVEKKLLVQILSADRIEPIDEQKLTTYLRLMEQPFGLILNFGAPTFKQGVRHVVNNYRN